MMKSLLRGELVIVVGRESRETTESVASEELGGFGHFDAGRGLSRDDVVGIQRKDAKRQRWDTEKLKIIQATSTH